MTVPTAHVLYAVNTGSGLIDQITDYNINPGIEQLIEAGDGKVDPEYAATITQAPVLSFTSTALAKALAISGFDAFSISTGVDFFFQKMAAGGTRASGSNHVKLTVGNGMIIPRRLRAARGQAATIQFDVVAISSDGINAPLAVATSSALSGSPDETEKFTVGPVDINGTLLGGVQDIDCDFGIQEYLDGGDGEPFNTFIGIQQRRATINVTTKNAVTLSDLSQQETIDSGGLTSTTHYGQDSIISNTQVSFWKLKAHGVREAKDATSHVVITLNEGRITVDSVSGSGNTPLDTQVVITPTDDGTNDPFVISTGAALPT